MVDLIPEQVVVSKVTVNGDITRYNYQYNSSQGRYAVSELREQGINRTVLYASDGSPSEVYVGGQLLFSQGRNDDTLLNVNAQGELSVTKFNEYNKATSITYPDGSKETWQYIPGTDLVKRYVDQLGITTEYWYNDSLMVIKMAEAKGLPEERVTTYEYDQHNNPILVTISGADGKQISNFSYDNFGNVLTHKISNTLKAKFSDYNALGNPRSIEDGEGNITSFSYDAYGNVTARTNAELESVSIEYSRAGLREKYIDEKGNFVHFAYSSRGEVKSAKNQLGEIEQYSFNSNGLLISRKNAEGEVYETVYDRAGQPIEFSFPDGRRVSIESGIDPETGVGLLGKIRALDTGNYRINYSYDEMGNVAGINKSYDSVEVGSTLEYDSKGRVVSLLDQYGNITNYAYDAFDNIVLESTNGKQTKYRFDYLGNVSVQTTPLLLGQW